MRFQRSIKQSLAATLAITMAATSAFGTSLSLIPTLSGDTANDARAITQDGAYVVGLSGSRGFFYPVGDTLAYNVLSSDNAQSSIANGIGYRTSGGGTEIIVSANTSSGPAEYMTTIGGTTFGVKRRNTAMPATQTMGAANQLGSTTASDVYYVSSSQEHAEPANLLELRLRPMGGDDDLFQQRSLWW